MGDRGYDACGEKGQERGIQNVSMNDLKVKVKITRYLSFLMEMIRPKSVYAIIFFKGP